MVYKRIISFLISIVICFSVIPVCRAEYIGSTSGFWSWFFRDAIEASQDIQLLNPLIKAVGALASGDICEYSGDGYHYADDLLEMDPSITDEYGRASAKAVCKYCNQVFNCYVSDFEQAYETQVSELPATGVTSSGDLLVVLYPSYMSVQFTSGRDDYYSYSPSSTLTSDSFNFTDIDIIFNETNWSVFLSKSYSFSISNYVKLFFTRA